MSRYAPKLLVSNSHLHLRLLLLPINNIDAKYTVRFISNGHLLNVKKFPAPIIGKLGSNVIGYIFTTTKDFRKQVIHKDTHTHIYAILKSKCLRTCVRSTSNGHLLNVKNFTAHIIQKLDSNVRGYIFTTNTYLRKQVINKIRTHTHKSKCPRTCVCEIGKYTLKFTTMHLVGLKHTTYPPPCDTN